MPLSLLHSTGFWALALLGCQEVKRDRERERERVIVSGCGKISSPCPCLFALLSVSHTVSTALHIFDPLHCLFSQHRRRPHLSVLSLTVAISQYRSATWRQHCHLRCFPAVCTVMAFVRAIWGWRSPAATHSPNPSGIRKFWILGLQFSAPAPGLQVPRSSFSAFCQGHLSVFGPQSRSMLRIKTHFGVPKAESTVLCSLQLSLVLWLQNYERTP